MKKKIALVTGWYVYGGQKNISDDNRFMTECFFESSKKYFLPNHDVDFIFVTNGEFNIDGVKNIHIDYTVSGFWEMCLMKILSLRYLEGQYDYIFVNDNDQIFIKEVSEEILNHDFVFLDHWFNPSVKSIHQQVTNVVELNFDTSQYTWTMGNFFGGKSKNVFDLLSMTESEHKKHLGHNFEKIHFYSRYPEELFIVKYVYENNISHKRLNCCMNPLSNSNEFFLSEFSVEESDHYKIKNSTLLHNTKQNFEKLRKIFKKPKIVVCQFYTNNVSYGKFSEEINRKYCDKNNYIYYVEKDGDKIKGKLDGRSWTWYKPHLIQEVFDNFNDCDYVLFLDIDAIFSNNQRKIEEFIDSEFSILMTHDYGPSLVNAGVMLLKNDQFSKNFIKEWWDICERYPQYKTGLWHDQTCIGLLYDTLIEKNRFKIIQNHDFNARNYNEDKFIFHAFSFGSLPNRTIDSIYYKKFNILPDKKELNELGTFYGTDKQYNHNYYNRFYTKILEPYKSRCDILEIGIDDGKSLKVWRDYFDNGIVHGIDNIEFNFNEHRIETFKVNQSDEQQLINFSELGTQYDVIIDDGTHKMKDQQVTCQLLFKNLKPGGLFIFEDLQTSIECKMPEKRIFGWGNPEKTTCLDMLESIVNGTPITDYITSEWQNFINSIESVEISKDRSDSIYAIIKKK